MNCCQLHFLVDGLGVNIQSTTEDVWETDYVVNLVWIVSTSGRHQYVRAGSHSVLVTDLRHRIGQSKDYGVLSHRLNHILRQHVTLRQSYKYVGILHGFGQSVDVSATCSKELLLLVQVGALCRDYALRVKHHDVLLLCADGHIQFCTTDGSGSCAVYYYLYLLDILADHLHGVLQSGSADDSGTVLVVVHYGDVESLLQSVLDIEALRRLDVLQVDTAECWGDALHSLAELLGILFGHLDIKHVDTAIYLKQQSFTLHYWLSAQRAYVAESQHSCTVRDYCHQITLVCILIRIIGILLNLQTGVSHSGRVGKT